MDGKLFLKLDNEDGLELIELDHVYYVPSFAKKVISIPSLVDRGYHFVFKRKVCVIIAPDKRFIQVLASDDGMFYLNILRRFQRSYKPNMKHINDTYNFNTEVNPYKPKVLNINDIHDKLGHVGETVLRKTMKHLGYTVTGTLKSCDACRMAKARAKGVKKQTETRSTIPGERMYIDITGPFSTSLGGSKYWVQVVDDATRMGFTYFMKKRDDIRQKLDQLMHQVKTLQHSILIIRCDNAGENTKHIQEFAREYGLRMEYTSPYTPQMNGVVERRIAVLKLRCQAMLNQADLPPDLRNKLWIEAARCSG
jgi:transposase InsO family protein